MIVLTTATAQNFEIIPTKQSDIGLNTIYFTFKDETTQIVYNRIVTYESALNDLFIIGSNNLDFLIENNFYELTVMFSVTNEVIYKDRIFCTNQTVKEYSINQNEYFLPNIDNNFYKI